MEEYLRINRESWNQKVGVHIESKFYANDKFVAGETSLKDIELKMLGNIEGKTLLHLQCHFGQDTISLSRLGADTVGIDLSDKAIEAARELAAKTKASAKFICSDVYDLPNHLTRQFDIVFTTYGTIGWLPDLDKWARVISNFLKPGGQFIFVEFHPVVWMFDNNFEKIAYRYFNSGPIEEVIDGTYAEKEADLTLDYVSWNHSLDEVITSLISNDLLINEFKEYDYSPYDCFKGTIEPIPGRFRIKKLDTLIPMTYSIKAVKKID